MKNRVSQSDTDNRKNSEDGASGDIIGGVSLVVALNFGQIAADTVKSG